MKDYGRNNSEHISVGNWMFTLLFWFIPGFLIPGVVLVGGAAYCVFVLQSWVPAVILLAFPALCLVGGLFYLLSRKKSKRNFILAVIIWWLIFAVLCAGAYLVLRFAFGSAYEDIITKANELIDYLKSLLSGSGLGFPRGRI